MTQPSGATPPAVNPAATDREDAIAQDLLADAMSDAAEGADHLGDPGKKALDAMKAQRKAALDELKAAHAKLKEYEDRDKTEAQRTAERLAAAEQTAADATARLLRLEVGAEKGLTPAQARRLVGTTREELEADADELLASFPATQARPPTPKPDPSQGPKAPGAPKRPTSLHEAVQTAVAASKAPGG